MMAEADERVSGAPGRHAMHAGERQRTCPNCGTPTPLHYCPECGQHAHVPRSIGHVLHELVHGVLHLDGKFWRTLPMLFFWPGRLTRNYIDGKRARYVPPFGIFLFTVFAMYVTFAMVGPPQAPGPDAASDNVAAAETGSMTLPEAREHRAALAREVAALDTKIDGADASGTQARMAATRNLLDGALADFDSAIADAEAEQAENPDMPVEVNVKSQNLGDSVGRTIASTFSRADDAGAAPDSDTSEGQFTADGDLAWLNEPIRRMFDNPDYAIYRIKQSAYKFSFLLLPLSLPFVWLLFFWRRDLHLYDHTVFILYSLSFMSLLFIGLWLALAGGLIGGVGFAVVSTVLAYIHMYAQLKGTYGLGWGGALVRASILAIFANVVLVLFALIVVALGAFI